MSRPGFFNLTTVVSPSDDTVVFSQKSLRSLLLSSFVKTRGRARIWIALLEDEKNRDLLIDFFTFSNQCNFSEKPISLILFLLQLSRGDLAGQRDLLKAIFNFPCVKNNSIPAFMCRDFGRMLGYFFSAKSAGSAKEQALANECIALLYDFIQSKRLLVSAPLPTPAVGINDGNDLTPIQLFEHHFSNFPREELWRLFCDGMLQQEEGGWIGFCRREVNFLIAMTNGFGFISQTIMQPLTVDYLIELHRLSTDNVLDLERNNLICPTAEGKRDIRHNQETGFRLLAGLNFSFDGLIELTRESQIPDVGYSLQISRDVLVLHPDCAPAEKIAERLNKAIVYYAEQMATADTREKKLECIVRLIAQLERIHPFSDGNCRTLCVLVLNRELIRNGFLPVILDNPNRFDGFSIDELMEEVKRGMQHFLDVKSGNVGYFGKTTQQVCDMHPSYKDQLDAFLMALDETGIVLEGYSRSSGPSA
jgi:hypothetical protein